MTKNMKTVSTQDYEEVVSTVARYIEGLRVGSADGVAKAFHKDAIMYGFAKGELFGGPIKNLYDFVETNARARHQDADRRAGDHAYDGGGAVDMEKDAIAADYTDFHSLIKLEGAGASSPRSFTRMESSGWARVTPVSRARPQCGDRNAGKVKATRTGSTRWMSRGHRESRSPAGIQLRDLVFAH